MKFTSALGALGASSVLMSTVGAIQLDISSPGMHALQPACDDYTH
jgi:hypothetical protein